MITTEFTGWKLMQVLYFFISVMHLLAPTDKLTGRACPLRTVKLFSTWPLHVT